MKLTLGYMGNQDSSTTWRFQPGPEDNQTSHNVTLWYQSCRREWKLYGISSSQATEPNAFEDHGEIMDIQQGHSSPVPFLYKVHQSGWPKPFWYQAQV